MYRIQSVGIGRFALTVATIAVLFYAGLAFTVLLVSWMIYLVIHLPAIREAAMLPLFPLIVFAVAWLFFYPFAALFCYLYNQVAKITGGIEFSIF